MAGLGRRSHYRKHLTDAVLHDFPEPQENECIAKVVATRGGNQFDVLVVGNATPQLAILPSKFHKLIWVKRGDYCIVQTGENVQEDTFGGVRFIITHILYKDQIKHLKAKNMWPNDAEFETIEGGKAQVGRTRSEEEAKWTSGEEDEEEEQDDGIVYDTGIDEEFFVNTNRVNAMQIQDSSESDSSDDDGDIRQQDTDDGIVYDTQDDELFVNTNRVAALRIEDSESESSEEEGAAHAILQQETDDGIDYDTGDVLSDLAEQQIQESKTENSHDEDDLIRLNETDDGIVYDTADIEEVADPSIHPAPDGSESENSDNEDDGIRLNETDDGIDYDTGYGDPATHLSDDFDSDDDAFIHQHDTDDGIVYDTGDAEEIADPSSHPQASEDLDSDDEDHCITQTETSDSLVYDTGKGDGIFKSAGKRESVQIENGGMQESDHDVV